jgi:hypothetical protein
VLEELQSTPGLTWRLLVDKMTSRHPHSVQTCALVSHFDTAVLMLLLQHQHLYVARKTPEAWCDLTQSTCPARTPGMKGIPPVARCCSANGGKKGLRKAPVGVGTIG